MVRFSYSLFILFLCVSGVSIQGQTEAQPITLNMQSQRPLASDERLFEIVHREEKWNPQETALIVCDVWDYHHSLNAVKRLEEFAPRLNAVIKSAREKGITVIHAPSDCMDHYQSHPARKRAMECPKAVYVPYAIEDWCSSLPSEKNYKYPVDQSDGGADDDENQAKPWAEKLSKLGRNPALPWKAQSPLIEIDSEKDFISDRGGEVWNILENRQIKNVILTGVHVNMCVLGRPFGLRQMARNGKHVVLMRDMTDSMYNPKSWPYVDHYSGTELVLNHIERHVCSTITSDTFLGGKPFHFQGDTRRQLTIILSPAQLKETPWLLEYIEQLRQSRAFSITVLGYTGDAATFKDDFLSCKESELYLLALTQSDLNDELIKLVREHITPNHPIITLNKSLREWSLKNPQSLPLTRSLTEILLTDANVDHLTPSQLKTVNELVLSALPNSKLTTAAARNDSTQISFKSQWEPAHIPSSWETLIGPDAASLSTAGWYRCVIKIPGNWKAAGDISLNFAPPTDLSKMQCFLNGQVAQSSSSKGFSIPTQAVNADDHNLLVIRVSDSTAALNSMISLNSESQNASISLVGKWQFRLGDDTSWANIPLPAKFGCGADIVFAPEDPLWTSRPLTRPFEYTPGIEGPAVDRAGNIYAVNYASEGTIGRTSSDGTSQIFLTLPAGSVGNGIRFDRQGNFFVADYTRHYIHRVDGATGQSSVLAMEPKMNQPNDLAIADDGTLFASDPNWKDSTGQLWRIDTDGKVTLLVENMGTTNGIDISPDGKTLYVNESAQRNVWAFTITEEKTLKDKRLIRKFDDFGFDGMRVDVDGNLYITRYGKGTVVKMTPAGEVLREIPVLGSRPSNICFGGPDGCTAYVTEVDSCRLVSFRVDRPGREWQPKRRLIVHADDAGMSHSANQGTFEALRTGITTSASIITPAPWFKEFAVFAKNNPQYDYGIHLALNSEWEVYRWGSVAPADKVPSLLDNEGYLWDNVAQVAEHAKAEEVEIELRAQIDKALKFGVPLSHVDTHMGALLCRPDIIDVYVKVGEDYNLPILFLKDESGFIRKEYPALRERFERNLERLAKRNFPVLDHLVQIYGGENLEERKKEYLQQIRSIPPGLSQLIIHCGYDNDELRAITSSSKRRNHDRELFSNEEMRDFFKQQGIELTTWREAFNMEKRNPKKL